MNHRRGGTFTLWKYYKVFCALVVTAERSVDELFIHYFHYLSSASLPHPTGAPCSILGPRWETFVLRPLICPPLENILRAPIIWRKQRNQYYAPIHCHSRSGLIFLLIDIHDRGVNWPQTAQREAFLWCYKCTKIVYPAGGAYDAPQNP